MKKSITIRLDVGVLADVRQAARADNRTLTNYIETVLVQRLRAISPSEPAASRHPSSTKDKPSNAA